MAKDPVCGMQVDEEKAAASVTLGGKTYYFCSSGCKATFERAPKKYAAK
jgi:YHS domain-containing protein